MQQNCPVCNHQSHLFTERDGYQFFACEGCGMIFIDTAVLDRIDSGQPVVRYQKDYWEMEFPAAVDRCRGAGIARLAEAIFYCRRPVERFIDIGTGTGFILDYIARYLPKNSQHFFGVETFPPPEKYRTRSPNYIIGDLASTSGKFDAGMCVEVIEHLTPKMLKTLFSQLDRVSNEQSLFLFNTGLAPLVRELDITYVDPANRGHICFWTTNAIDVLGKPHGLRAIDLPGRHWAFLVEKQTTNDIPVTAEFRLQNPLPENRRFLADGDGADSILVQLATESGYHYLCENMATSRTRWAMSLLKELGRPA